MLGLFIGCLAMSVEAALLFRGLRTRSVARFPLFYSYLLVVFLADLVRLYAYLKFPPELYTIIYWVTQLVSLVMGSIVIFEIYRLALREFSGTAKMGRNLLAVAFAGIFLQWFLTTPVNSLQAMNPAYVRLERDLRFVQSVGILILVVLFLWYAIPLGRNLSGILLGYGVFVALSVMQLTVVSHYGTRAQQFWNLVQPWSFVAVLGIWAVKLWSPDEITVMSRIRDSEESYEELANATGRSLGQARSRLGSTVRP
ncbi:MAG TPA: hypothetical protein VL128_09290 [Candidatus Eisenbacteria bacterium]|nr:hypothetical protein [Candidatus Eisenbacteria bacterium]